MSLFKYKTYKTSIDRFSIGIVVSFHGYERHEIDHSYPIFLLAGLLMPVLAVLYPLFKIEIPWIDGVSLGCLARSKSKSINQNCSALLFRYKGVLGLKKCNEN